MVDDYCVALNADCTTHAQAVKRMKSTCDFEMRSWHPLVREWNEKRVEYKANYFQLLGLDENATEEQIKAKEDIVLPFDVASFCDDKDKDKDIKAKVKDVHGHDKGHGHKHYSSSKEEDLEEVLTLGLYYLQLYYRHLLCTIRVKRYQCLYIKKLVQ